MKKQTSKVLLNSDKVFLQPSLLRQLEESITRKLSNYDGSADSAIKIEIQVLKQHLRAAGVWARNGDDKKLGLLHEAMEELNFTSRELEQEGIGKRSRDLIARHGLAYDKCESLVKEMLENHDLPATFFLTIQAAAELRHDKNHERGILSQITKAALKNDASREILAEIRRKA